MELTMRLPRSLDSPGQARRAVEQGLSSLPGDTLDVVLLLTTELVTNAVRHGSGDVIELRVSGDDPVEIVVVDEGAPFPAEALPSDGGEGGRGLFLLERLATSWGIRADALGKAVWFRLTAGSATVRS